MKQGLFFMVLMTCCWCARGQSLDYIVIKKKGRAVQTYFAGAFLSAEMFNGFNLNGWVKDIRHDSIFIVQQDTRLVGTNFGSVIDTVYATIGFDYREVSRFNVSSNYGHGFNPGQRSGGFLPRILPSLMTLGGIGYLVLELVNGQYRHESLDAHHKLASFAVAGGVAAGGIMWRMLQRKAARREQKYQVIYVHKSP